MFCGVSFKFCFNNYIIFSGSLIGFLVCHAIKQSLDDRMKRGEEHGACLGKNGDANEESDEDDVNTDTGKCQKDCDTRAKAPYALSSV